MKAFDINSKRLLTQFDDIEWIENCLQIKAKVIDYDRLFADEENVVGI